MTGPPIAIHKGGLMHSIGTEQKATGSNTTQHMGGPYQPGGDEGLVRDNSVVIRPLFKPLMQFKTM